MALWLHTVVGFDFLFCRVRRLIVVWWILSSIKNALLGKREIVFLLSFLNKRIQFIIRVCKHIKVKIPMEKSHNHGA